jgi:DNA-binding CsgD family transcriptional regulator
MKTHENLKYESGMQLCPREGEALVLAALGHSTKESARIMNIAASTIKGYLDSAREKLHARNIAHAVSLAWEYGLIGSKYLGLMLFVFAVFHSAINGDTDQRNTSRPLRTVRAARTARSGRRDGDSILLPETLHSPNGNIYLSLNQWWSLISSSRSAA